MTIDEKRTEIDRIDAELLRLINLRAQLAVDLFGLKRAAGRRRGSNPDRFEAEAIQFHERLREAYLALAAAEPERCVIVDASAPKKAVAQNIWRAVNERLHPEAERATFTDAVM